MKQHMAFIVILTYLYDQRRLKREFQHYNYWLRGRRRDLEPAWPIRRLSGRYGIPSRCLRCGD